MKKTVLKSVTVCVVLALLMPILAGVVFASDNTVKIVGEYYNDGPKFSLDLVFDTDWFFDNPGEFNPQLCSLSCLMSTFVYNYEKQRIKMSNGSEITTEKELLELLGFSGITEDSTKDHVFDNNYALSYFAHRTITKGSKSLNLIVIDIRGTHDNQEWVSNLGNGDDDKHEGFTITAEKTLRHINDYLEKENVDGKQVYWIMGHSRGGAISNMLSDLIKDSDCFVYTFASPNTVKNGSTKSVGAFNIINGDDAIPVYPNEYKRFGKDKEISYYDVLRNDKKVLLGDKSTYKYLKSDEITELRSLVDEYKEKNTLIDLAFLKEAIDNYSYFLTPHNISSYYAISQYFEYNTVVIDPVETQKKFGEDDPILSYNIICKSDVTNTVEGALARESGEDVGKYKIGKGDIAVVGGYDLVFKSGRTFTIVKADAPSPVVSSNSFIYDEGSDVLTFDIDSHLPSDCGKINYTLAVEGNKEIFESEPLIKDGKLYYQIKPQDKYKKQSADVLIDIEMKNYENVTYKLNITLGDKSPAPKIIAGASIFAAAAAIVTGATLIINKKKKEK